MEQKEKIIQDLLVKGKKQVVDWITKLNAKEIYYLLAENLTYNTIIELIRLFDKDFKKENSDKKEFAYIYIWSIIRKAKYKHL